MSTRRFRWVFAKTTISLAVLAAVAPVAYSQAAASAQAQAKYSFDLQAQPLEATLRAIARQTSSNILFEPKTVAGKAAKAIKGQYTVDEVLARIGSDNELELQRSDANTVIVREVGSAKKPAGAGDSASVGAAGELQKVEVTGSRLKRIDTEGPVPVAVYRREDIDRSGQPTIERFLSSLNEASISPGEGALNQTSANGSVQLRGLPLGSTLVLINGRRLQAVGSGTANIFNLDLIPMAAVERIEVVPVGSSAVYGGDALAGVVNIILKKSIEGVAMDLRLGAGSGTGDKNYSLTAGRSGSDGSFLVLGSYSKSDPLTMAERDFFKDGDFRRFGGVDTRTRGCTPGTVASATTANLPGLNSTIAVIPKLAAGQSLSVASFAATAGQENLCNPYANGDGQALFYGREALSLHAIGERNITDGLSVFGELTFSRDLVRTSQWGLPLANVLVPASNAFNPFGAAVRVTSQLGPENGSISYSRTTNFVRALAGVRASFGQGWELEATLSTTRDDGDRHQRTTTNTVARTAALASSNPATALNPFTAGLAASEDVLAAVYPDSARENHGKKNQVSAFIRGALGELPAGKVEVIAGLEAGQDRFFTFSPGSSYIDISRTTSAMYGEMRIPLLRSDPAAGPGRDVAAITIAARRDKYSDFGSANTYQAGGEFRPSRSLLFRASAATSFKPPTLLQTAVDDTSLTSEAYGLLDPLRGNAPVLGGEVLRTTNHALQPERGRSQAIGAVWEPEASAGTRLGVNVWRVEIKGLISLMWPQDTLTYEAYLPGFVTRAPTVNGATGAITRVLYTEANFGKVQTSGVDLEAAHSWKTEGRKWTVAASATRTTEYEVAVAPTAPVVDRLGRRAVDFWAPQWKGRLAGGLDIGAWNFGVTSRYLGAYKDTAPSERSLGNYWTHDLAASANLKLLSSAFSDFKDAKLAFVLMNVGNRLPEFIAAYPYYDYTQGDWRGRYASLRLSAFW